MRLNAFILFMVESMVAVAAPAVFVRQPGSACCDRGSTVLVENGARALTREHVGVRPCIGPRTNKEYYTVLNYFSYLGASYSTRIT